MATKFLFNKTYYKTHNILGLFVLGYGVWEFFKNIGSLFFILTNFNVNIIHFGIYMTMLSLIFGVGFPFSYMVAGVGLMYLKNWAKYLCLACVSIDVGLHVYGILRAIPLGDREKLQEGVVIIHGSKYIEYLILSIICFLLVLLFVKE